MTRGRSRLHLTSQWRTLARFRFLSPPSAESAASRGSCDHSTPADRAGYRQTCGGPMPVPMRMPVRIARTPTLLPLKSAPSRTGTTTTLASTARDLRSSDRTPAPPLARPGRPHPPSPLLRSIACQSRRAHDRAGAPWPRAAFQQFAVRARRDAAGGEVRNVPRGSRWGAPPDGRNRTVARPNRCARTSLAATRHYAGSSIKEGLSDLALPFVFVLHSPYGRCRRDAPCGPLAPALPPPLGRNAKPGARVQVAAECRGTSGCRWWRAA